MKACGKQNLFFESEDGTFSSEMSVALQQTTRRYIPEDSTLHMLLYAERHVFTVYCA
jgi:hypothetical protein